MTKINQPRCKARLKLTSLFSGVDFSWERLEENGNVESNSNLSLP